MKPAIASSFSRAGMSWRVDLADRLEQDVPALQEQRVEHLVLGAEVVVDEPVGDARLVGDVATRGRCGSPGGRRRGRRRRGSAGACRPRPAASVATRVRPSAVDLRAAVGERGQVGADRAPGGRGRARRRCGVSMSGAWASTIAPGVDDHRAAAGAAGPGACAPTWLAATTKAWFSIARARSRTSQWSRVVGEVNAAGTASTRAPSTARRAVELGEAQVVADGQAEL